LTAVSWLRLDLRSALIVSAVLGVVALVLRLRRGNRAAAFCAAAATEASLVCALFALWQLANRIARTGEVGGLSHGRAVWRLERWLHLPTETSLQHLVIDHHWLVRAANYYYAMAHLTGMVVFLAWLWLRHRDRYPRWRNVVVAFTGIALLIEMIPVAPPRLIGGTGLVDTAMTYGQSVYAFVGSDIADQYAALPSIHVGWAVLIGVAMVRSGGRIAGTVGSTHAVLTVLVVVATANHYWLDGVAAGTVLAAAIALVSALTRLHARLVATAVVPAPRGARLAGEPAELDAVR
jgi:hypothetical protein